MSSAELTVEETAQADAEAAAQVAEILAQASVEGERFYRQYLWVRILLWKLLKYRPDDFEDDEVWEAQMASKLSSRDLHCIYAVLVLWDKAEKKFDGDPKAKVLSIHRAINHNKEIFATALYMAEEVLGIKPITVADLHYDADLNNAMQLKLQSVEFARRKEAIQQQLEAQEGS